MTLPKLSAVKRNSNKSSAFWDNSNSLGTFACSSAPTNGIYSMSVTSTGLWVVLALPISTPVRYSVSTLSLPTRFDS
ncbi:hypothetical protein EmuJ_000883400 [Echinococcus multilocularis]|uniref:Uncharacterized protein n=1 Tax=Echinococcus multilocularis TaxID=6211 RepID=A0A068YD36_ECHMU|nr:hypothetical protein EmuJ_000883400 [Echinococcus multilocularis]